MYDHALSSGSACLSLQYLVFCVFLWMYDEVSPLWLFHVTQNTIIWSEGCTIACTKQVIVSQDLKVHIFDKLCVSKLCNDFVKLCSTFGKLRKSQHCKQCKLWEDLKIFYMQFFVLSLQLTLFCKQTFIFLFDTSILVNINSLVGSAHEILSTPWRHSVAVWEQRYTSTHF